MSKYEEVMKKYFKEEGIKVLRTRFESLVKMHNNTPDEGYPMELRMFGFPIVDIKSRIELEYRLRELGELVGMKIEVKANAN